MSDYPLIGCLYECQVLSAGTDELFLEGPIFTSNKVNRNGWGIPDGEAEQLAKSLEGKPIRYCPQGKVLPEHPDVPAAHMCDAQGSKRDIVGEILKVYPAGVDDKGRTIYHQRAKITDLDTIKGITSREIPSSWSVFLYAKKLKDRMVQGARGAATSIVDEPAYTEAEYEWRRLAASFFTLPRCNRGYS